MTAQWLFTIHLVVMFGSFFYALTRIKAMKYEACAGGLMALFAVCMIWELSFSCIAVYIFFAKLAEWLTPTD